MATNCGADATNLHSDPVMIPVISYIDNYTKIAINHDLEHSSITNCFLIVLYHVVQLRFDNSQYTNMLLCYVMSGTRVYRRGTGSGWPPLGAATGANEPHTQLGLVI